jgi:hypothetical protein
MSILEKILAKVAIKIAIFAAAETSVTFEKFDILEFLESTGIFLAGSLINEFYIKNKEQLFRIVDDDELNTILTQYVFALAWQIFLSCLIFKDKSRLLLAYASVTSTYALFTIIKKNYK